MSQKQFTLYLTNQPGELARVTRILSKSRINIEGISASTSADTGLIQVVTNNAGMARKALNRARIPFTVQEVAVVRLPNRPGTLYKGLAKLAKAKVNINYVYATACGCKGACECYAVISSPDLTAVESVWKKA